MYLVSGNMVYQWKQTEEKRHNRQKHKEMENRQTLRQIYYGEWKHIDVAKNAKCKIEYYH